MTSKWGENTIEIDVPTFKYKEMAKKLSTAELSESDKASGTVFWNNQEFIIHSAMGTGTGIGWALLWGSRVEDLKTYKGTLKPLERSEHYTEIELGRRKRSFNGRIIKCEKRKLVCCEDYTFYEVKTGEQAALF